MRNIHNFSQNRFGHIVHLIVFCYKTITDKTISYYFILWEGKVLTTQRQNSLRFGKKLFETLQLFCCEYFPVADKKRETARRNRHRKLKAKYDTKSLLVGVTYHLPQISTLVGAKANPQKCGGHGKSTWIDFLCLLLAIPQRWYEKQNQESR